jgi:hypothetical protein
MNSIGPWWGTPAVTFGGVLLTLCATVWLDYRKGRRETAFRWADRKIALYTHLARVCRDARGIPVWPETSEEPTVLSSVRDDVGEVEYLAPPAVVREARTAMAAMEALLSHVATIRRESAPGHHNAIAARFAEEHQRLVAAVTAAVDKFVEVSRTDVDIKSKFTTLSAQQQN